jgi:ABC-type phosphate transport system substrate-binding protein
MVLMRKASMIALAAALALGAAAAQAEDQTEVAPGITSFQYWLQQLDAQSEAVGPAPRAVAVQAADPPAAVAPAGAVAKAGYDNLGIDRKLAVVAAAAATRQAPAATARAVPVVNVEGVRPGQLKLTGAVIADIYLGNISMWDAPQIARLNPGVVLPHSPISVVHRSDSSTTSLAFTRFLASASPTWDSHVGAADSVKWMVGVGGVGDAGVAAVVQHTENSIGYVDPGFAAEKGLPLATVVGARRAVSPARTLSPAADPASRLANPDRTRFLSPPPRD